MQLGSYLIVSLFAMKAGAIKLEDVVESIFFSYFQRIDNWCKLSYRYADVIFCY